MKKIKLLTPILGLTVISSTFIPLTSCGGGTETPEQEAKHIKTTYDTPKVGEEFVVTFTLDNGYSLDIAESRITFSDSNAEINLSQCIIDSTNKKITVPKDLVTSTKVTVSLKSVKPQTTTEAEKKQAIENVLSNYDNKNCTIEGTETQKVFKDGEYKGQVTYNATTVKMVGHNGQFVFYDQYGKVANNAWFEKATDFGWWMIQKQGQTATSYTGTPHVCYPLKSFIGLLGMSYDEFIKELQYDAILDTYSISGKVEQYASASISFTFNHNKEIKNIILFAKSTSGASKGSESIDTWSITNKGTTSIETTPTHTKKDYVEANKFTYDSENKCLTTAKLESSPNKVTTPALSKFTDFDKSKKTYIYFKGIKTSSIFAAESLLYNGTKLLTPKATSTSTDGDYYVYLNDNDKTYAEINGNVLDNTQDLKFIYSLVAGGSSVSQDNYVIITQTKPA